MIVNGNEIEILAPAGSFDNLKTSILSGADSVYFGLSNFNARRNAENFSKFEDIKEAVDFCHLRGKKAHVTLNTLVYDNEIKDLIEEIEVINKVGFDAIIVQDLGVINILRQISKVPLHASTQLSVHNVSDAKKLKDMGFDRVVLSRELSLNEIKRIMDEVDVEVEIFIHGALCMSVSGQCYFSSALGERSGNRGLCAGVCRLPFCVKDKGRYDLSLKDVCFIDYIEEFANMGIASLKIEGRMKSNEYVKSVVSEIRNKIESGKYNKELLKDVFSRSGFTDGYITGKRNNMFGIRSEEDKSYTKAAVDEIRNKDIHEDKVKVNIKYDFSLGKNACLKMIDEDNNRVFVKSDIIEEAKNKPTTKENIEKNLLKLGSTVYHAENITGISDENIFLPVSKINEIRRNATDKLDEIRLSKFPSYDIDKLTKLKDKIRPIGSKNISVINDLSILDDFILDYFDETYIPLFDISKLNKDLIDKYKDKIGVEMPRVYFDDETDINKNLLKAKEFGIKKGLAHTIGKIHLLDEMDFDIMTGFGTNITNSYSVDLLEKEIRNLRNITLSFENTINNINKINTNTELSIIVYGYLPLMTARNCPIKEEIGCKNCNKNQYLIDRMDKKFRVKCNGQTSEIYNTYPLCIFDKLDRLDSDINKIFIFNNESIYDIKKVITYFEKKEMINNATRGCYFRKLL
ncbi:peptidase U32 family protein [Anaerofustis stercorihominis]|uniref:peptidase U32 family protein n=1 Tax=Anaerofustis stercorihominis TaxID=214853 RepID=UPI00214C629D|nr:U32 family peptidase [Anaerofustis stercorihominis]MCR2032519.1 U32 family peptidase [Anaerofustis stercorihominis]